MVRRQEFRDLPDVSEMPSHPQLDVIDSMFFVPPKGLDYLLPRTRVSREHAVEIENFWLDRTRMRSRRGIKYLGLLGGSESVVFLDEFTGSDGTEVHNNYNSWWATAFSNLELQSNKLHSINNGTTVIRGLRDMGIADGCKVYADVTRPATGGSGSNYFTGLLARVTGTGTLNPCIQAYLAYELAGSARLYLIETNGGGTPIQTAQTAQDAVSMANGETVRVVIELDGTTVNAWTEPAGGGTPSNQLQLTGVSVVTGNYMGVVWRTQSNIQGHEWDNYTITAVGGNAIQIMKFRTSDGSSWIIRFLPSGVEYYNGTDWSALPGSTSFSYNGTIDDRWCWTTFGDRLIFSNGIDGTYEFDPAGGLTKKITEAPPVKFLTTFNGRVVGAQPFVSGQFRPLRVVWSVKNNSNDWTGEGSGFEDLLSTPTGQVDACYGAYPVGDFVALLPRAYSVWTMRASGNVDAPFNFERIVGMIGTDAPYTMSLVPGGLMGLFRDDIYYLNESEFRPMGSNVVDEIRSRCTDLAKACATYNGDPSAREYMIALDSAEVYRYSFRDQGWSRSKYINSNRWIEWAPEGIRATTIDELTGTIDALTGTIDSLGGSTADDSGILRMDAEGQAFVEDLSTFGEETSGGVVANVCRAETAVLVPSTPLKKIRIIEIQIEYESSEATPAPLVIEYSYDDGATWSTYGTVSPVLTTIPRVIRAVLDLTTRSGGLSSNQIRLRVSTTPSTGQFALLGFHAFTVEDELENH